MIIKKFVLVNIDKFVVFFFLLYLYQLPLNVYSIYLHNYQERLLKNYGYCEKESYGYLKNIYDKQNNKNIHSYNFGDFSRSSSGLFFKIGNEFDDKKIVILNYYSNNIKNEKRIIDIFGEFEILDSYQNACFLIQTNKPFNVFGNMSGKLSPEIKK
jgi:hypothetical protein